LQRFLPQGASANAQTNPNSAQINPSVERHAAVNSATIQMDQIRASKMLGSSVFDLQNRTIGRVKDLVLDKDAQSLPW